MSRVGRIDGFVLGIVRRSAHLIERLTGTSSFALGRPIIAFHLVGLVIDTHGKYAFAWVLLGLTALVSLHDYRQTYVADRQSLTVSPARVIFLWKYPPTVRVLVVLIWTLFMFGWIIQKSAGALPNDLETVTDPITFTLWLVLVYIFDVDPKRPARSLLRVLKDKLTFRLARPVEARR